MRKNKEKIENDKSLMRACQKKYFFENYKQIIALEPRLKQLGIEGALECCYALFDEGKLWAKIFDKENFFVFLKHSKNKHELVYNSSEKTNG